MNFFDDVKNKIKNIFTNKDHKVEQTENLTNKLKLKVLESNYYDNGTLKNDKKYNPMNNSIILTNYTENEKIKDQIIYKKIEDYRNVDIVENGVEFYKLSEKKYMYNNSGEILNQKIKIYKDDSNQIIHETKYNLGIKVEENIQKFEWGIKVNEKVKEYNQGILLKEKNYRSSSLENEKLYENGNLKQTIDYADINGERKETISFYNEGRIIEKNINYYDNNELKTNYKYEGNNNRIVEKNYYNNGIIDKIQNENLTFTDLWNREACRPQNPISGAKYNGGNRLILGFNAVDNDYKDPRWVTFIQAKNEGWKIPKGTKSVTCEKWIFPEKETITDENGEILSKVDNSRPFPKQFNVFNVEQLENVPPLEIPQKLKDEEAYKVIKDLIASSEVPIKEIGQDRAYYNPSEDHIILPPSYTFENDEAILETILHEMVHSTGHNSRLNRKSGGSNEYAREELVAELGAIFLKQDLGIELKDHSLNNSSAYLESYLKFLRDDPNELFRASAEADKASKRIIDNYNEFVNSKENEKNQNLDYFKNLEIKYHWSEADFNIKEETLLKGVDAYNFLKEIITKDREHNEYRERDLECPYYYKTKFDIKKLGNIENYNNVRVDIGDLEFNGKTNVAQALNDRFDKVYFDYILKNLDSTRGELTKEQWHKEVLEFKETVKTSLKELSKEEKEYINSKEKKNEKIKLTQEERDQIEKDRINSNYKYIPKENSNSKKNKR